MAKYLVHQNRDGQPVGIWRNPEESFYDPRYPAKELYGKRLIEDHGQILDWEEFVDDQTFRWPGPYDMWDSIDLDGTLEMNEAFDELDNHYG